MSARPVEIALVARESAAEIVPSSRDRLRLLAALFALGFALLAARTVAMFLSAGGAP